MGPGGNRQDRPFTARPVSGRLAQLKAAQTPKGARAAPTAPVPRLCLSRLALQQPAASWRRHRLQVRGLEA
eukprot:10961389-Alexandrium_andersonii.AAC.1